MAWMWSSILPRRLVHLALPERGELEGYSGGDRYIDLDVLNKDKSLQDLLVK